jgi:hypothetical protein
MQPSQRNQVLTFVFVLLFIVLVGEILYFYYSSKNNKPSDQSVLTNEGSTSNNSSALSQTPDQSSTSTQGNPEKNIYQETLSNNLKLGALGYYKSSTLTSSYSGKIERINTKNVDASRLPKGYLPVLQIILRRTSFGEGNLFSIYFNQREYDTAYVYENSKNGAVVKNIQDLKEGQTIDVVESLSILDNNMNVYYEISINP